MLSWQPFSVFIARSSCWEPPSTHHVVKLPLHSWYGRKWILTLLITQENNNKLISLWVAPSWNQVGRCVPLGEVHPDKHSGVCDGHTSFFISTFMVRNVDAVKVCSHNHLPLTPVWAVLQTDGFYDNANKTSVCPDHLQGCSSDAWFIVQHSKDRNTWYLQVGLDNISKLWHYRHYMHITCDYLSNVLCYYFVKALIVIPSI